jgi:LysM repeat protein
MKVVAVASLVAALALFGCKPKEPQTAETPVLKTDDKMQPPADKMVQDEPPPQPLNTAPLPKPPAPIPAAPAVGAAPAGSKAYVVQAGDKGFYPISRKLFGNTKRVKEIQALNPGVDPTKLKVGQTIYVPEK